MTELARAEVTIGGNDTPLQNALARSSRSMQQTGQKMSRIGRTMTATVTAPLVAIGAAALKMSSDFEKSMTEIQTLVGLSTDRVAQMRQEILDLAPAVGRTPQELASALFAVTSAGARGAEAMAILERSAKAAAAGLGDTREIARATVAAMTAFEDQGLTAAQASDILVATVREGNLAAQDLAGSLGRVLGPAAAVGASFEEVGAFIATFTRVGVSSEEAVTSLTSALNLAIRPTEQARQAMAEAGFSVDQFRRAIEEDGLQQALARMVAATEGNLDVIGEFIPNVRALRGILATAGAQGEEYAKIADNITNSQGILNEAFEDTRGTTAQTFAELKAQAATLAITWGDDLAPTFSAFLRTVDKVIEAFTDMPKPMRRTIAVVAGITAAVGPLALALGGLIKVIGGVTAAFATLRAAQIGSAVAGWASAFASLAVQVRSLSGALALLQAAMGPTGWLILGATALTGIAVKGTLEGWASGGKDAREQLDRLTESLDGLVEKSRELSRGQIAQVISSVSLQALTIERQIQEVESRLAELRETPPAMRARRGVTEMIKKRESELAALQRQLQETQTTLGELRAMGEAAGRSFDMGTGDGDGAAAGVGAGLGGVSEGAEDARRSVSGLAQVMQTTQQIARAFGVSIGTLPTSLDGIAEGARRSFGRFRDLTAQMLRVREANERIKQQARDRVAELGADIELAKFREQLDRTREIARDLASSFTDAFMSIIDGSKNLAEAFGDMVQSLIADMARAIIQKQLFDLVFGLIGGGPIDAPGPIPEPAAPNFAGGFQHGGTIPSGSFGVVGERGPELVTGPAKVVPMEAGGGREVHIHEAPTNINIAALDPASFREFAERNADVFAAATAKGSGRNTGLRRAILAGR